MNNAAIAIIPARGGSKRVPRKNIREMLGRPLISYTVEAALESNLFNRVLVSTDCPEIANISKAFGAEVPFLRGAELSDDLTPVSAATLDLLMRIDPDGQKYDSVCQLMANCPLRNAEDVIESYRQFTKTSSVSQISVVRYGWQNPWWAMRRSDDYTLDPLFQEAQSTRSQDLPELFCPTGAIWWAKSEVFRAERTFHVDGRTGWEIDWQKGIDIDTEEDWIMAEAMMSLHRTKSK